MGCDDPSGQYVPEINPRVSVEVKKIQQQECHLNYKPRMKYDFVRIFLLKEG